jgi:MoaA/NifB/PqqE/SkfB family radical SAM enzyme
MRCVYCAVSQPTWEVSTLDLTNFDKIVDDLKNRGLQMAIMHGHGETTIVEGWHEYARKLQQRDVELVICSNLAREYSEDELDVLSEFTSITVSLDTINPALFRKLRKGGDIRQIIFNQTRIQALAKKKQRQISWVWSSVVVDQTIDGILDLIHLGISLGVETFCFCNLTEHPDIEIQHLSKLTMDDAKRALAILVQASEICEGNGAFFDLKSGLLETLEAKVAKAEP